MKINLKEIFKNIESINVAVYGDFCLDVYWIHDPLGSEISVETGQQAAAIQKTYTSPGGAANVVSNLAALQPKSIKAIGVIGDDMHGRELTTSLQELGVDTTALITQDTNFDTYTFVKQYEGDTEISRSDFGVSNKRTRQIDAMLSQNIELALTDCDVLIFNQQIPGSISNPKFIEEVNTIFAQHPDKIILVDSRHYTDQFENVSLKINDIEIAKLCGADISYQDEIAMAEIERYGLKTYQIFGKPIFITCGQKGIVTIDEIGITKSAAIQVINKIDTVGAGDTVLSALALSLAAGCTIKEATALANLAAAVTIQKLFTTGTATAHEILSISENANFIYQPELAENLRQANYKEGTSIELCYPNILERTGQIKHAVFDHDGTISTLREGWEKIMEPVMIKAILGDQYATVDTGLYQKIQKQCAAYIDQSTGIQTIVQMQALSEMVVEFGLVAKEQILDKFGYKAIFNEALLAMVNSRVEKLKKGELGVEDFTIKGTVDFLHLLKENGTVLYLASGTDQDDVIKEAMTLGYADLFEGRIYGSIGDISKYSKKMVIEKIMSDHQLQGEQLLVIGDGPVEIQECRRAGGIAVGIASDEPRRYGLNPEKRTRLIRAGAQIIIPDFAQTRELFELLFS